MSMKEHSKKRIEDVRDSAEMRKAEIAADVAVGVQQTLRAMMLGLCAEEVGKVARGLKQEGFEQAAQELMAFGNGVFTNAVGSLDDSVRHILPVETEASPVGDEQHEPLALPNARSSKEEDLGNGHVEEPALETRSKDRQPPRRKKSSQGA